MKCFLTLLGLWLLINALCALWLTLFHKSDECEASDHLGDDPR